MTNVKCPSCRKSDDIAGVVVRGVYDGVLYWECMACAKVWHRFRPPDDRYNAAHEHIENRRTALRIAAEREWNRERASRGQLPYDE
jgi:formate dehydrogenase maturation protein FdhE